MTESLIGILMKSTLEALKIPLIISFVMVIIMMFMEMHEKEFLFKEFLCIMCMPKRIIWQLNIIQ